MRAQGDGGSIVNISSIDAIHRAAPALALRTSKHAIWGLTKTMALELGPDGIRVNAVAPGPSLTEGAVEFVEAGRRRESTSRRSGRVRGTDPAAATRASRRRRAHHALPGLDLSSYVNGAQIVVDGGLAA